MDCGIGIRDSNWVIWDWNGTLLDDLWLTLNVTNTLLAERGIGHLNQTQYRAVFGFPLQRYYSRIGFDFGKDSFDDLANEWCPLYERKRKMFIVSRSRQFSQFALVGRLEPGYSVCIARGQKVKNFCE